MRTKKIFLTNAFMLAIIFSLFMINAEILLSQPNAVYSLGEELSIDIKLDAIQTGYIDLNLLCNDGDSNIYHDVPEETSITIKRKLTPMYIGNLSGQCKILANYGSESKISQGFEINNKIEIIMQTEELTANAGEKVQIKGTAYKKNNELLGQLQDAFVEIRLYENTSLVGTIKDSQFEVEFAVPENMHSGIYPIAIIAYEKDAEGSLLNFGNTDARIIVIQKPARISLALDKTSLNPAENISIMAFVYDNAGDNVNSTIFLEIKDSGENSIFKKMISADELILFEPKTNNLPGYARVSARSGNLSSEKTFYIAELKKISAVIGDGKVTIINTGNIKYEGPVEIQIGSEKFVEMVSLEYNTNKTFDLTAPDGYYDVSINDGNPVLSQTGVSLTGNAVSLRETGMRVSDYMSNTPIVWIFVTAVMVLFLFASFKKQYQNRKISMAFGKTDKKKIIDMRKKGGVEIVNTGKVVERIISGDDIRKAEQMTVLHGQKHKASIIALKLKNDISGIAEDNIAEALEMGYKKKAVSYSSGNSAVLIFSPLTTKTGSNEETAVKTALEIDAFLKEHNRKFRNDKISYGIGVNSGEIVNQLNGKVLQFANINKTISIAKKVADLANEEVLLSKEIHERTPNVKTEKVASGAMELFSVKRVVDSEGAKKFMNEFVKRNSKNQP
jgi:class 3 adenylate cyclase